MGRSRIFLFLLGKVGVVFDERPSRNGSMNICKKSHTYK